ncbi:hypothetical protein B0H12DRAFT_1257238 [Mycena haematopus]|nr:hypothetical protein B0H12DRAFT_1257238 [Mycena haematopus]
MPGGLTVPRAVLDFRPRNCGPQSSRSRSRIKRSTHHRRSPHNPREARGGGRVVRPSHWSPTFPVRSWLSHLYSVTRARRRSRRSKRRFVRLHSGGGGDSDDELEAMRKTKNSRSRLEEEAAR